MARSNAAFAAILLFTSTTPSGGFGLHTHSFGGGLTGTPASPAAHKSGCSVVDFGAKGDGTTVDTKSINAALAAEQCDEVVLPSGHTFVSGTIVLQSNKVGMHPCTHDTYERASERASE